MLDQQHAGAVGADLFDQRTQGMYTDERMDAWLAQVVPLLREKLTT